MPKRQLKLPVHAGAVFALSITASSAGYSQVPTPVVSRTTVSPLPALCHKNTTALRTGAETSMQKVYSAASAAGMHPTGPPIVVFLTPLALDVDPGDAIDWETCLPISEQTATATLFDVNWQMLPSVIALTEPCGVTDSGKDACLNDLKTEMRTNNLKMVRLWSFAKQPDGTIQIVLAVDTPVTP
jgi:hypothetical protein